MMPWIDFKLFGNGFGLSQPSNDGAFFFLNGHFYKFSHFFGSQLTSIQWTRPLSQERRMVLDRKIKTFSTSRKGPRVMVEWQFCDLPKDLDEAHDFLNKFKEDLNKL